MTTPLATPASGRGVDVAVLILVALAPIVLHVGDLGFYSDDWVIAGGGTTAEDRSLVGIMEATGTPDTPMRPINLFVLSLVFWLFGANPLAFHLVNTGYIAAMAVCFYLVLRELNLSRALSFATAAFFVVMPHYSATRFWIVAHPINLSMVLYFIGVLGGLKAMDERPPVCVVAWTSVFLIGLVSSLLAYEQLLPLAALTPSLIWWHGRRLTSGSERQPLRRRLAVILTATAIGLAPVVAFKMSHTARISPLSPADQLDWSVWYLSVALSHAYVEFGLKLPLLAWRSLRDHADPAAVLLATMAAGLAYVHLRRITGRAADKLLSTATAAGVVVAAGAVFVAGFGLVVMTTMPVTSPTGSNNRLAIVAAVGVALSVVTVIGWVCGRLPGTSVRRRAFPTAVAVVVGANVLVVSTLASFWAVAAREQHRVLDEIHTEFPDGPPGQTLLLDGACPYVGPATVFDSSWDLREALTWRYGTRANEADVVTGHTTIEPDGVHTSMFGGFLQNVYAYSEDLYVYRVHQRVARPLPTYDAALAYFNEPGRRAASGCPPGEAGHGASVLGIRIDW